MLTLRSPSNRRYVLAAGKHIHHVETSSASETTGQWVLHSQEQGASLLAAVSGGARLESVGSALLHSCKMDDVGEEFLLVMHAGGLIVVRICLSPNKCPIGRFHAYLAGYLARIGHPNPGPRSVGGRATDVGRDASIDESTYRTVFAALELAQLSGQIKSELSKHERGAGGASGIDALRTLAHWKAHSDWYRVSRVGERVDAYVQGGGVTAIRTVPRDALGSNLFLSASCEVLRQFGSLIPPSAAGSMVLALLTSARQRLQTLDKLVALHPSDAWSYLQSANLPRHSAQFAQLLAGLRQEFSEPSPHTPSEGSRAPYFLQPPEIIFQWYAIGEALLALGLSEGELKKAFVSVRGKAGFQFERFSVWADTAKHGLKGWRRNTSHPADYEPDLLVTEDESGRSLLLDAKFRRSDVAGRLLSSSSIKDIQAYMQEYSLCRAVVLLPMLPGDPPVEDVMGEEFWIRGIPVPPLCESVGWALAPLLAPMWNDV